MVFDVDKLKEAVERYDNSLRVQTVDDHLFADLARLGVAGQPLRQCGGHDELGNCVMVEGWWMPTGGNK